MDIRQQRTRAGLSLSRLANLTGYDRSYLGKVERGLSRGSDDLHRRCRAVIEERSTGRAGAEVVASDDNMPTRADTPSAYQTFGAELQRRRKAAGLTLRQLADGIPCHPASLSNYERGRRVPSRDIAALCDGALGAGGALLALLDPTPQDVAPDCEAALVMGVDVDGRGWFTEVDRRTALRTGVALGVSHWFSGSVTPADTSLAELTNLFSTIRVMCQQVSPQLALPMLISKTNGIRRMSQTAEPGKASGLLTVASHYAIYTGKMFQEAGDFTAASRWTAQAHSWAQRAGSPGLLAYVLARQALLRFYDEGPADEIIGLARAAQRLPRVSARTLGLAALREALGHAAAGDERSCRGALDHAGELLERAPDEPAESLSALEASSVSDHVAITMAYCLFQLGRPGRAAAVLDIQLAAVSADARRTHVHFGARQALAHGAAGEIDQACALTWQLLPGMAETASATALRDLRGLARVLNRHRRHPGVASLLTEINNVLTVNHRSAA